MSRDFGELNPYASPSAPLGVSEKAPEPSDLRLFFRWEKLRILYNLILAAVTVLTLVVAPPRSMPLPGLFLALGLLCFAANVCYCIGPVLDGYARLLGIGHQAVTVVIFTLGTGLAVLLALFAVLSFSMSGFD